MMRSLVARVAWLAAAAAVITALLAAGLTVGIVRSAANSEAQRALSKLADAAQTTSDLGPDAEAAQRGNCSGWDWSMPSAPSSNRRKAGAGGTTATSRSARTRGCASTTFW